MNPDLARLALLKIGNPNVLVNLVSRRVRQLTTGGGAMSRPLLKDAHHLGWADVALREIVEDKITAEFPVENTLAEVKPKRRRKSST